MALRRDSIERLAPGSEMGPMIAGLDWGSTRLGPIEAWPQSLHATVGILLTSRFAMWMSWGPDLAFLYNDSYAPTLGIKHGWALGRPSRDVWAEIWPDIGPRIERVLATGEATWDEALLLFLERSGYPEETYHTFSYSPLRDDAGRIAGHLCVVTEETERVISERRLRTLGELAAGLTAAPAEQDALDAARRVLDDNRRDLPFSLVYLWDDEGGRARLAAATGFDDAHADALHDLMEADPGVTWPMAAIWAGEQAVRVSELPRDLPNGAWTMPPREALAVAIARQGQERPAGVLIAGINPHRYLDDGYMNFLGLLAGQVASALASARAYETERRRAAALAELDRAKTAFFSNVSHEFRTPLTLMIGPLQDALERADTASGAELRPLLELGERNAVRLLRLVNTLLDFSRIEAERVQVQYRPVDLARLTAELASAFHSAMERAGLDFVINCEPLGQPVFVDAGMWEKIVLNLLSNAFKFTFAGEIRVELRGDEDAATLVVRDTGTGIPAVHLSRIFERFHRIEGSRGRSHEGSGIGLALVRDLVALHGGQITVDSEPDRGSAFVVRIPFGHAHLPAEQIVDQPSDARDSVLETAFAGEALSWLSNAEDAKITEHDRTMATAPPAARPPTAGRILLADDNADMRDYVRRLLCSAGHEVETAGDGETALATLRSVGADLLLTDIMMPRLDGLGLLRAVRAEERLRDIPVILLSARAGEEARVEGFETQADDYLTKPFSARELLARVNANLATARLRRRALEEQRAAQAALRALADTLEQRVLERTAERDRLWELSEDLLVAADYDGQLLRVSPSWTRLLGHSAAHLLSAHYNTVTHPDDLDIGASALARMRQTMQPVRFENRLVAADGSYRSIAWALSPEASGDSLFGIGRDVTAERAAHAELLAEIEERERIEATLAQMQRLEAVGQLTSGVAHDFNNLLTVILGNLDYVGRGVSDEKVQRRLGMMRTAARRGANLTGQLLAFSRKQHLDPRALDLNEAICGMDDLLRSTLGGTVRLEIVLAENVWPAFVDQTQLELVILNLAINARDAMPVGGALTIATGNAVLGAPHRAEEPSPGEYVVVTVTDAGTGMTPDVLERVFEPFFTTKEPGKGSGLGLAQVYGFAKQSGGGVRIDTRLNEGTSFRVFLPRAAHAAAPASREAAVATAGPVIEDGRRALLVDDDEAVRDVTRLMLEELGFRVTETAGGEAALDLLAGSIDFDVVLIDFAMPDMNGAELAARIGARHPDLPILLVTGYADTTALQRAGDWPLIAKPFAPEQLASALTRAIDGQRGGLRPVA